MLITEKGQVTIPIGIREQFGFLPHTEIDFVVEGDRVVLQKIVTPSKKKTNPFESLIGVASCKMTTDEIMALTRGEDE